MSAAFPESWVEARLDDLVHFRSGPHVDPRQIPPDAWVLELDDLEKHTSKIARRLTHAQRNSKSAKTRFAAADVLLGKLRPYQNKIVLADGAGYCTTEILPITAPPGVDPRFLFYALKRPEFLEYVTAASHGLSMPRLGAKAARAARIPLAPYGEQQRIADKLDRLLPAVEACKTRLAGIPAILERFSRSVLAAAASGTLTHAWRHDPFAASVKASDTNSDNAPSTLCAPNKTRGRLPAVPRRPDSLAALSIPSHWALLSVADLLRSGALVDVKDGNHGANHPKREELGEMGLPFITAAQVVDFQVNYAGARKIGGAALARIRVGLAEPGDVILTHKGSVGRVAIASRKCVLTPQTTYYRVDRTRFDPEFLMYFMASPIFSAQLDERKSQTTRDFVPMTEQYHLHLAMPPLNEQMEIARRVAASFAAGDRLSSKVSAARSATERLTQSLLSKAFRGELVPQNPNDEPAAQLLARIRLGQRQRHLTLG